MGLLDCRCGLENEAPHPTSNALTPRVECLVAVAQTRGDIDCLAVPVTTSPALDMALPSPLPTARRPPRRGLQRGAPT